MQKSDIVFAHAVAKIKRARLTKQIKQETLGNELGWTKSQISRFENGERNITLKKLLKMMEILEIDPSNIFE
jgi:transcriptional regulator with XRE-family HTH domain